MCTNFTHRGGLFDTVQQLPLMSFHLEWKVTWNLLEWSVSPLLIEITFQWKLTLFGTTVCKCQ